MHLLSERSLKRLHSLWLQLYDTLEKEKLWEQWNTNARGGGRAEGGLCGVPRMFRTVKVFCVTL